MCCTRGQQRPLYTRRISGIWKDPNTNPAYGAQEDSEGLLIRDECPAFGRIRIQTLSMVQMYPDQKKTQRIDEWPSTNSNLGNKAMGQLVGSLAPILGAQITANF